MAINDVGRSLVGERPNDFSGECAQRQQAASGYCSRPVFVRLAAIEQCTAWRADQACGSGAIDFDSRRSGESHGLQARRQFRDAR